MRSANEPLGGAFAGSELGFWVFDALVFGGLFAVDAGVGFGRDLGSIDEVDGLETVVLAGPWVGGLGRRCSCASAFRFIPAPTFPFPFS